jgi:hypothetical protein
MAVLLLVHGQCATVFVNEGWNPVLQNKQQNMRGFARVNSSTRKPLCTVAQCGSEGKLANRCTPQPLVQQ